MKGLTEIRDYRKETVTTIETRLMDAANRFQTESVMVMEKISGDRESWYYEAFLDAEQLPPFPGIHHPHFDDWELEVLRHTNAKGTFYQGPGHYFAGPAQAYPHPNGKIILVTQWGGLDV